MLKIRDGKILLKNNAVATEDRCCCGQVIGDCCGAYGTPAVLHLRAEHRDADGVLLKAFDDTLFATSSPGYRAWTPTNLNYFAYCLGTQIYFSTGFFDIFAIPLPATIWTCQPFFAYWSGTNLFGGQSYTEITQ